MSKTTVYKWKVDLHKTNSLTGAPDCLIFDAQEEANQWIAQVGNPQFKAEKVAGRIKSAFQPTSFASLGVYGRSVKVWEEMKQ